MQLLVDIPLDMGIKTLYLLRHAKALAIGSSVSDRDRPLSQKGVKDVDKLANKLSKKDESFDLILMSPAVRTISTGQLISKWLHIPHSHLVVNEALYAAETMMLLKIISSVSKKIDKLMIIGHNPGIMNLASLIADEPIAMPTCAMIKFTYDLNDWHEILTERASKFSLFN